MESSFQKTIVVVPIFTPHCYIIRSLSFVSVLTELFPFIPVSTQIIVITEWWINLYPQKYNLSMILR